MTPFLMHTLIFFVFSFLFQQILFLLKLKNNIKKEQQKCNISPYIFIQSLALLILLLRLFFVDASSFSVFSFFFLVYSFLGHFIILSKYALLRASFDFFCRSIIQLDIFYIKFFFRSNFFENYKMIYLLKPKFFIAFA